MAGTKSKISTDSDDDPEAKSRVLSILSYFVVLIVIGVPVWWYTTRVYRANLPLSEMFNVEITNKSTIEENVPLSLEYDLLISFVHPDAENLNINLDGEILERKLQPYVEILSPVANFVVKSQWLFLTELGVIPKKINGVHGLLKSQLPHIITPLETKLWTHLSPRPTLNLVIYFPRCSSPLNIHKDNHEKASSNAFVSSRWGGFFLLNPDKESCNKKIFNPDTKLITSTFVSMLQQLLDINGFDKDSITELKVRKTEHMISSTRNTLKSLAQLLLEISSIVISDEVADKINVAVENADKAELLLKTDLDQALKHAKVAFKNSEEAFSHPSLLALLYFPDDQKYAIYIPLFLPVMIPVVMSVMSVLNKLKKAKKVKSE